jgi:glucose-1-phosphate thymidylyltransferase
LGESFYIFIAYTQGYIGADAVRRLAEPMRKNEYGMYLLRLLEGGPA